MDKTNGVHLVAPVIERRAVIPSSTCGDLGILAGTTRFDVSKINKLIGMTPGCATEVPDTGLNYYDLHLLNCCIKLLAQQVGRKIRVVEVGAGTTTRMFCNHFDVEHIKTYAKDDVADEESYGEVDFMQCDITHSDIPPLIVDSCKRADLLFIDGDHSYNFAEHYCNNILKHIEIPVMIHDFLSVTNGINGKTWGEQYYLIHEFLPNQKRYRLELYSAISEHEQDALGDANLKVLSRRRVVPCVALFTPPSQPLVYNNE